MGRIGATLRRIADHANHFIDLIHRTVLQVFTDRIFAGNNNVAAD